MILALLVNPFSEAIIHIRRYGSTNVSRYFNFSPRMLGFLPSLMQCKSHPNTVLQISALVHAKAAPDVRGLVQAFPLRLVSFSIQIVSNVLLPCLLVTASFWNAVECTEFSEKRSQCYHDQAE